MALLEGKVAIITGAARGIGRACAELFAEHGARVVLSDIDAAPTHEAAEAIKADDGDAFAIPGDVTDPDFAPRLIKATLDAYGAIDAIVNNAGYTWDGTIHKMSDEQWQAMLDVHLTAPFESFAPPPSTCVKQRSARKQTLVTPRQDREYQFDHRDAR